MSTFSKTSTAIEAEPETEPVNAVTAIIARLDTLSSTSTAATSVPVVLPKDKPAVEIDRTMAYEPTPENVQAHAILLEMHTYRRPARSKTEKKFINKFLIPLGLEVDKYGNFYKKIGKSPILWSSHTDTVHTEGGIQSLGFDMAEFGISEKEKSSCLGADDTAGVWLMVQMILAKVPGLYIFHRDEEGGRKGSEWISKHMASHLKDSKFAIALDRKGTTSIITHQMSRRCCSGDFCDSLAAQLGLGLKADDTGSYTDTASYVGIIPECTNISVGYYNAHSSFERLDRDFIFKLRDALIAMDQTKLIETRVAGTTEYKTYTVTTSSYRNGEHAYDYGQMADDCYGSEDGYWNGNRFVRYKQNGTGVDFGGHPNSHGARQSSHVGANGTGRTVYGSPANKCVSDDDDEPTRDVDIQKDYEGMVKLIARNPEAVADILEQFGYGYDELSAEILQIGVINY